MKKLLKELRGANRDEAKRLAEIDRVVEIFRSLNARVVEEKVRRLGL